MIALILILATSKNKYMINTRYDTTALNYHHNPSPLPMNLFTSVHNMPALIVIRASNATVIHSSQRKK